LQEYCQSISFLRATESSLKLKGLISNVSKSRTSQFSVSQTGGDIQRDQGLYGGSSNDSVIGKRQHPENLNGVEGDEVEKRVKE
jgi:hypothetical protein